MCSTSWLARGRVLAIVVILLVSATVVLTTPKADDSHPPRRPKELLEDLPYLDSGPRQSELKGGETIADVAAWSKLVFQSVRDGNWEIYIADGDASNQVRVTHAVAADIHPSLDRGGTRIAYASNYSGNYEIHTRTLSREHPFRLTFTSQNE